MLDTRRLREVRQSRGLTQESLAKLLEMHPQTIWHWEKGNQNPSRPNLHRLAGVLRVNPDYLMGVTDDRKAEFRGEDVSDCLETPLGGAQNNTHQDEVRNDQISPLRDCNALDFANSVKSKMAKAFGIPVEGVEIEIRITI